MIVALAAGSGCDKMLGLVQVSAPSDAVLTDGRTCGRGTPFSPGMPVTIAATYSVEAARFNRSQTLAYLSLCDPNAPNVKDTCDVYTGLATGDNALGGFNKMTGVSDATHYDSYPAITPDGQYLTFSSSRNGASSIYVAVAQNASFDAPMIIELPSSMDANEPYVLGDSQTLYFSQTPDEAIDSWDLARSSGPPPMFGSTSSALAGIDDAHATNEFAPVASDDELELFFASDRQQPGGDGLDLDIYAATRRTTGDVWSAVTRIDALSTAGTIDWPLWLSPDGCKLYYINKPHVTNGIATLYYAVR